MAPTTTKEELKMQRDTVDASAKLSEAELVQAVADDKRSEVRMLKAELLDAWDKISSFSKAYYAKCTTIEEKTEEMKWITDFNKRSKRLRVLIDECLEPIEAGQGAPRNNNSANQDGERQGIRTSLTKLDLKKFDGENLKEWKPWWEHFCAAIHHNPALSKVEKFNYLVTNLTGRAYDTIKGFSIIKDQYDDAVAKMEERFDRDDALQASHFSALTSVAPVGDRGDIQSLRRFYDEVISHIRCLAGLGVEECTYTGILKPTLLGKLPTGLVVDWHRKENHNSMTVSLLLEFVRLELQSREDTELLKREHRQNQQKNISNQSHSGKHSRSNYNNQGLPEHSGGRPSTATQLAVGVGDSQQLSVQQSSQTHLPFNQSRGRGQRRGFGQGRGGYQHPPSQTGGGYNNPPSQNQGGGGQSNPQQRQQYQQPGEGGNQFNPNAKYPCVFCKGKGHFPVQCTMAVGDRWQLVQREKRYHVCLRDDHVKANCPSSRTPCKHCEQPHHSALHFDRTVNNSGSGARPPPSSGSVTRQFLTSVSRFTSTLVSIILLKTATILIVTPSGPREAFCLLDDGSQRTFIRRAFAEKFKLLSEGFEYLSVLTFGSGTPSPEELSKRRPLSVLSMQPGSKPFSLVARDREYINPAPAYVRTKFARELIDQGYYLADNRIYSEGKAPREVDLLIGSDYYNDIIGSEKIRSSDGLTAVNSVFGWILNGPAKKDSQSGSATVMMVNSMAQPSLDQPNWQREIENTPVSMGAEVPRTTVTMLSAIERPGGYDPSVEFDLQTFWKLESQATNEESAKEGDGVRDPDPLEHYPEEKIIRLADGSFQAELPWMKNKSELRPNLEMSMGRLQSLLVRIRRTPDVMKEYHQQILENIAAGYVEEADMSYSGTQTYLPHHPVVRPEKSTTKVRPVFDGSARTKSAPSINEVLYTGPNITPDLLSVLLRFRIPKVAWIADIKKAFHQVRLAPVDSQVIRFLWVKDPCDPNSPVVHYVWKCLPFGLVCSPYILRACINKLLDDYSHKYPDTVNLIRDQLYVDDGLGGASSTELAASTMKEIKIIFASARMTMRKWTSNDPKIREEFGEASADDSGGTLSECLSGGDSPKVLGLVWNQEEDVFQFNPRKIIDAAAAIQGTPTKRQVAQIQSRIFDPLGFLAPVTVLAKLIFQKIWTEKIDWDQPITPEIEKDWYEFISGLGKLSELKIPRRVIVEGGSAASAELHVFCDASTKAYGAVAYLRSTSTEGKVQVSMLTGRTKIAPPPPKALTVARLELLAAQLGSILTNYLIDSFRSIRITRTVLWSDSTITLCWIKGQKQRKVWVQNRINIIKKFTNPKYWFHCPGEENPADIASRGATAEALISSAKWWNGPEWLIQPESKWPTSYSDPSEEVLAAAEGEAESKASSASRKPKVYLCAMAGTVGPPLRPQVSEMTLSYFPRRFSTLDRMLRVTSWIFRFIRNVKKKVQNRKKGSVPVEEPEQSAAVCVPIPVEKSEIQVQCLAVEETGFALDFWLGQIQREAFPKEYRCMSAEQPLRNSKLTEFRPVWDVQRQLIRVSGRVQPVMDGEMRDPPILLPDSVVRTGGKGTLVGRRIIIDLLVRAAHKRVMHAGLRATLAELREDYWMMKGRQVVKRVLKYCVICQRYHSRHFDAPAAALPLERTTESRPFEITGVDFAGPMMVRTRYSSDKSSAVRKAWICLFTCATTRAVHLELVEDLTTPHFLMAIRRFFSVRGAASIIYSDNAKTFIRAARYFRKLEYDHQLHEFLSGRKLHWRFSANLAPWWGGYWERMVRSTKEHLRKTVGRANLSFTEMQTVLSEISFAINSRPLTYVSDGSDGDPPPLTPFQLISGYQPRSEGRLPPPAPASACSTKDALILREERRRKTLQSFWSRWQRDYIADRMQFRAPGKLTPPPRLNQVVLIHDENSKRMMWQTAIVTDLKRGDDGNIRLAFLRTRTGAILNRPIQRLYPLELDGEETHPSNERLATVPPPLLAKGAVASRGSFNVIDLSGCFQDSSKDSRDEAPPPPPVGGRRPQCVGTPQQSTSRRKEQQRPAATPTTRRGRPIRLPLKLR